MLEQIKNFVWATPVIATAGQPAREQLSEVAAHGFVTVINLGLLDPRYCLPDEAGLVAGLGLAYHHIPVAFVAPRLQDLERFFSVMDETGASKVFVHCAANKRVTVFVALYGEVRLGWPEERADALITQVWQPNAIWLDFIEQARSRFNR